MLKQFLAIAFVTTTLSAAPFSAAQGEEFRQFSHGKSYKKRRHSSRSYKRRGQRNRGYRNDTLRPSMIIIGGGSSSRASANSNGNIVTIGSGTGGEAGPLNPVSNTIDINDDLFSLGEERAVRRQMRGIEEPSSGFVIIAGRDPEGDRVAPPVYMPDTYVEHISEDDHIVYFND